MQLNIRIGSFKQMVSKDREIYMHNHVRACTPAQSCTCMHVCTNTHTQALTHARTHAQIHTHSMHKKLTIQTTPSL
jgi:hypothetical protein